MIKFTGSFLRKVLVSENWKGVKDKRYRGDKVVKKGEKRACDGFGMFDCGTGEIVEEVFSIFSFCNSPPQGDLV